MTQKDKDKICQCCSAYAGCGFISRELQRKCDLFDAFEDGYDYGYDAALAKAEEWIQQTFSDWKTVGGNYPVRVGVLKERKLSELINEFLNTMKL